MALDAALLRSSFDTILERQPQITPRFYEILFARYPQVKSLFGARSNQQQAEMLQAALVAVLDKLEDASWLEQTLGAMGEKHLDYGVTDEMYEWVGTSLLATLAEVAGDDWTAELEAAWQAALGAVAGLMLKGAHAAQARAARPRAANG
jgi:hemoglobin-like flavoprotein